MSRRTKLKVRSETAHGWVRLPDRRGFSRGAPSISPGAVGCKPWSPGTIAHLCQ